MKSSGSKDTVLLFVVLLLALGAVCYLFVIKKNLDNLNQTETELAQVEQEKARNDAIIKMANQLDQQRDSLGKDIEAVEGKLLPDLNSSIIQRKIYKHFEDAKIPFLVKVENSPLNYETVTLPDGTVSTDRVKWATYTITVSGTDGFLLSHDEGDSINPMVFYDQLGIMVGDMKTVNKTAMSEVGVASANELYSSTYVGYNEFVAALTKIQADAPDYVKISNIQIEDMAQGFCQYTCAVDVYAYDLVNRRSTPNNSMNYMNWVGIENIATGGLVGLPSYFALSSPNYDVSESSPLYGHYISFVDYDYGVTRPFAAWNHWAYEWQLFDDLKGELANLPPEMRMIEIKYRLGLISTEDYSKAVDEFNKNHSSTTQNESDKPQEP